MQLQATNQTVLVALELDVTVAKAIYILTIIQVLQVGLLEVLIYLIRQSPMPA